MTANYVSNKKRYYDAKLSQCLCVCVHGWHLNHCLYAKVVLRNEIIKKKKTNLLENESNINKSVTQAKRYECITPSVSLCDFFLLLLLLSSFFLLLCFFLFRCPFRQFAKNKKNLKCNHIERENKKLNM